jgi:hypothetical protein
LEEKAMSIRKSDLPPGMFEDLMRQAQEVYPTGTQILEEQRGIREEAPFVQAGVAVFDGGTLLFATIPFRSASEANGRDWRARSRRSGEAWKAVSRTLGPHLGLLASFAEAYHADKGLMIKFVRLGGRKMDKSNLPAAMKGVEDALAFMLGADDGDPRWHTDFDQEPGGLVGVRIEVEIYQ